MPSPIALGLGAALPVLLAYAGPAALASTPANALVAVRKRLRDRRRVAITFDDGPQPQALEQFLRTLDDEAVRATFFIVGEQALRHPALVRQIHAAGHELGNHGFAHRNHLLRNPFGIATDIERGAQTIAELVGARPALFRPPYGVVTAATCLGAWRAQSRLVLWSRWGRDWRAAATPGSIARSAVLRVRGGDIVLLHDADHYASPGSWRNTLAALPRILELVRALGLQPTPIGGPGGLTW